MPKQEILFCLIKPLRKKANSPLKRHLIQVKSSSNKDWEFVYIEGESFHHRFNKHYFITAYTSLSGASHLTVRTPDTSLSYQF